jgi:uncharacterized protein (TIGR02145 family)
MPDNQWWLAEDMRYDASATKQSYKCPISNRTIFNNQNIACPPNWNVPSAAIFTSLTSIAGVTQLLATMNCSDYSFTDFYGFSLVADAVRSDDASNQYPPLCLTTWGTQPGSTLARRLMVVGNAEIGCWAGNLAVTSNLTNCCPWSQVRCFRQL